uniref:Uncharacterized protein n=1 Tax=Timema cristinae TaxID=61476 RepID=A0A7R9D3V0_TIMCR|nr:unnamed protein product [Timema cristinae]
MSAALSHFLDVRLGFTGQERKNVCRPVSPLQSNKPKIGLFLQYHRDVQQSEKSSDLAACVSDLDVCSSPLPLSAAFAVRKEPPSWHIADTAEHPSMFQPPPPGPKPTGCFSSRATASSSVDQGSESNKMGKSTTTTLTQSHRPGYERINNNTSGHIISPRTTARFEPSIKIRPLETAAMRNANPTTMIREEMPV